MAKFSSDHFPPGFFDLPQSAGETLPLEIIAEWTHSAQTRDVARALLSPHMLRGIIVSSDSAGLTRLGRERPLIEILAMLSQPKEIIHSLGKAIGGRAIGVWAADNTEMFYGGDISAENVVAMLRTAMERIARECELRIGMAAHAGEFYELSGGVYGPHADRVESIAEERTEGGELVITDDVVRALPDDHGFVLQARTDLDVSFGVVHRVTDGPNIPEVAVLNNLALTAAMKRIGRTLLHEADGAEVKNSGLIGIYTFADCRVAIEFARGFRQALADQGVECRIGIDAGPILVFELGPGSRDIAGSAVNVSSKLAQDVGEYGMIQVSDVVAKRASAKRERPTRTLHVSGVELRAYDV